MAEIREKFTALSPVLDERARRLWAAAESRVLGRGGDTVVSKATGLARATIRNGVGSCRRGSNPTSACGEPVQDGAPWSRLSLVYTRPWRRWGIQSRVEIRGHRCAGRARAKRRWRPS